MFRLTAKLLDKQDNIYRKDIFLKEKVECTIPLTHIVGNITNNDLKVIDELYGAADVLSIMNAKKHR